MSRFLCETLNFTGHVTCTLVDSINGLLEVLICYGATRSSRLNKFAFVLRVFYVVIEIVNVEK